MAETLSLSRSVSQKQDLTDLGLNSRFNQEKSETVLQNDLLINILPIVILGAFTIVLSFGHNVINESTINFTTSPGILSERYFYAVFQLLALVFPKKKRKSSLLIVHSYNQFDFYPYTNIPPPPPPEEPSWWKLVLQIIAGLWNRFIRPYFTIWASVFASIFIINYSSEMFIQTLETRILTDISPVLGRFFELCQKSSNGPRNRFSKLCLASGSNSHRPLPGGRPNGMKFRVDGVDYIMDNNQARRIMSPAPTMVQAPAQSPGAGPSSSNANAEEDMWITWIKSKSVSVKTLIKERAKLILRTREILDELNQLEDYLTLTDIRSPMWDKPAYDNALQRKGALEAEDLQNHNRWNAASSVLLRTSPADYRSADAPSEDPWGIIINKTKPFSQR